MSGVSDFFGRAEVMTLDRRLAAGDLGDAADAIAAAGLPVRRLLVGDGELFKRADYHWVDVDAEPRRQAFNYASAFLKAVRSWGDEVALYLEDDASLRPGALEAMPLFLGEFASLGLDWDVLFVGGNFTVVPPERISEHVLRCPYALDLHCVAFHPRCHGRLLEIEPSAGHTIDGALAQMMLRGELRAYGLNPPLAYQKPGFSWNENRWDDKTDRHCVRF